MITRASIGRYMHRPIDNPTPEFGAWRHRWAAVKRKVNTLRAHSLSQLEELFAGLIPTHLLSQADEGANSRTRVFPIRVTFFGFLYQVLKPRTSCREVVRQLQALFALQDRPKIDQEDSAYCQARNRLPEENLERILKETANAADKRTRYRTWFGHDVKVVDASCTSLADTPANQALYPQSKAQAPGCGFPLMKLVVFMSLASGAVLDVIKGNKHDHELSLFRRLCSFLKAGDLVLGDDAYSDYGTVAFLPTIGCQGVFRLQGRRHKDFRRGKKLGAGERLITWKRPSQKAKTMTKKQWEELPAEIEVRLIRVRIPIQGFRTRQIDIVTTLLDPKKYPAEEIAALFRRRWRLELCFRDIKTSMGMEEMRCKTPEMVHKELLMYLIAHNLIRCLMAEAASIHEADLERISFKGSVDTVRQYSAALAQARNRKQRSRLLRELLEILASDLLPDRPNRTEPRAVKRRPKPYALLNKHRSRFKETPHRGRRRASSARK